MRAGAALTMSAFYILLSLSIDDRHDFEILKDVTLSSAGRVKISPAILRTTLNRLLDTGLIVTAEEQHTDADRDDTRRRRYRLTHQGRGALAAELERMEQALKVARSHRSGRS